MATEHKSKKLKLSSSLHELREEKLLTDVVLICAEGEELAAHRVVLSAKSSYFKQMFLSDFKESITKQVDYSHIDRNNMQLILDFIYLNSLENVSKLSFSDLFLLYQTSHMFELKELSEYCWDLIITNITTENWLDAWNVGVLRGNDSDICKVLNFFMKNLPSIMEREEFLSMSMSQMMNFLGKINEFKFTIEDHLLEGIIRWSKKQQDQTGVQNLLLNINFDFISKEYMGNLINSEESLFKATFKQFFKKQIVPRLKTKTEIEHNCNISNPIIKCCQTISRQFFYFCCYIKKISGNFLYHKAGLRIYDLQTEEVEYIDNLPFHLRDGIVPVQHGSHIYVIGGLLNTASRPQVTSNFTKSFFRYDWETNSATELPPLPKAVTKDCHVCVVKEDIFVVQKDDDVENVILYFSINKSEWFVIENSLPRVIACVKLKDDLYLLCCDFKIYTLYKLNNSACTFDCSVPIEFKTETFLENNRCVTRYINTIQSKMVTMYKDEIFILVKDYCFYTFNAELKTWKIGKINFKFDNLMNYRCITIENTMLLFYNEVNYKLYIYDEETFDLKEINTIKGSMEDDPYLKSLGLYKYERMLVFAK